MKSINAKKPVLSLKADPHYGDIILSPHQAKMLTRQGIRGLKTGFLSLKF